MKLRLITDKLVWEFRKMEKGGDPGPAYKT